MKLERHSKIVELIGKYNIETQEELAEYLNKEGYNVTQATVSQGYQEAEALQDPGRARTAEVRGVPSAADGL